MREDDILLELRAVKEAHAARYGYDIRRMGKALMEEQKKYGDRLVSPPRRGPVLPRKNVALRPTKGNL